MNIVVCFSLRNLLHTVGSFFIKENRFNYTILYMSRPVKYLVTISIEVNYSIVPPPSWSLMKKVVNLLSVCMIIYRLVLVFCCD